MTKNLFPVREVFMTEDHLIQFNHFNRHGEEKDNILD